MKGEIERIWQNQDKKGEKYWVLVIDGERYSVWDEDLIRNLSEGDLIDFTFQEKGRFKNIVSLENLKPKETLETKEAKTKQIARMSCLRSASEILAHHEIDPKKKVDLALKFAKKFEDYVFG